MPIILSDYVVIHTALSDYNSSMLVSWLWMTSNKMIQVWIQSELICSSEFIIIRGPGHEPILRRLRVHYDKEDILKISARMFNLERNKFMIKTHLW